MTPPTKPGQEGAAWLQSEEHGVLNVVLNGVIVDSGMDKEDMGNIAARLNKALSPLLTELEALRAGKSGYIKIDGLILSAAQVKSFIDRGIQAQREVEALRACVKTGDAAIKAVSENAVTLHTCAKDDGPDDECPNCTITKAIEAYSMAKKSALLGGEGK